MSNETSAEFRRGWADGRTVAAFELRILAQDIEDPEVKETLIRTASRWEDKKAPGFTR